MKEIGECIQRYLNRDIIYRIEIMCLQGGYKLIYVNIDIVVFILQNFKYGVVYVF